VNSLETIHSSPLENLTFLYSPFSFIQRLLTPNIVSGLKVAAGSIKLPVLNFIMVNSTGLSPSPSALS